MDDAEQYRKDLAAVLEQLKLVKYGGVSLSDLSTQQTMEMFGLMCKIEETNKKLEETYSGFPGNVIMMDKK
jgi:hypothetical protein